MADLSSLVIRLSADVASLQSDLGKANAIARNSADQISGAFTKGIGQATGVVKEFAVALAAGFTVDKLVQVGKSVIDLGDNLNKMSQKVGVSVESLSSLRNAAALSDVSFEDLGGSMAKLARTASDAAAGGKEQAAAFRLMGVSIKDASGNLKPMQEILQSVSDKFATYKDSTEKTALAQKLFGKSGADLIPMLNQLGDQGFAEVTKQAEAYNQVIGSEQANQSEQFNDNLTRLTSAATGFASAIVKDMLPALVRYTDDMAAASTTTSGYADSAQIFANAGKGIVLAATAAKDAISALVTVVIGLGDTLGAAGDLFNGFALAVGNDLKALGLAAQGNFAEAKAALSGAGTSLAEGWNTAVARVKGAWAGVKGGVLDAVGDTAKAYDDLFGQFSKVSGGATTTAKAVRDANAPIVANADAAAKSAKQNLLLKNALDDLKASLKALSDAFKKVNDLNTNYTDQIADLTARMAGADDAQITYNKNLRDIAEAQKALQDSGLTAAEAVQVTAEATKNANTLMQDTRGWQAQQDAAQKMQEELKKTQEMYGNFADAVFDAVTQSGNFLKNLLNNLKQIVTQMLKEWFRTRVIGMFTGGGGSGVGALASLGAAAIGGGGSVGGGGMAGGADFTSSAIGATQNSLFNPQSWMNAGGSLYSGFENAFSASPTASSNLFGTYTPDYGAGTYAPSGLGYGLAAAGGIYAGYNRYQQAGGGIGGIAGAAAYGYGTYAASIGVGAAASGGIAAGVAAIPVVGWIALAAMLIDHFSGGKLFGTKGEVKSGATALNIGPGGADYSTFLAIKGQGALFSGAQWSTKNIPQTPEQKAAAEAYFKSMNQGMQEYAKAFGLDAAELLTASFAQQFDKNGKPTGTTLSNIGGHEYKGLTEEQFSQVYIAENELSVLAKFDDKLQDTVEKFRGNADVLSGIAEGLTAAEVAFQAGAQFLALGSDQSLSALLNLADASTRFGESAADVLKRIIQAQAQYDQFVAQFKVVNYVDDFEAALSGINATMKANIAQANALAKAAGAAGASEKDLANIHNYAAKQAADAIRALEASAQSLAFGLGITSIGSLDEVNQEIAALKAKADQGSGAIKGFGNAISDAASRATAAMNLLLGSLSPLNDQQKLQTALGGLRSGTATVDQVLEIGRRLYASSQAYTDLFNSVNGFAGRGTGSPTGGAGGGTGATSGGLSGAERQRLSDLLAEQQQLQAAATLTQYQTLAQQIAEIASAKGEDWRTVLDQMGISVDKFEAGLQLTDAGTSDLIASIQAQLDDNGENTTILADLLKQILVALGGTPTDDSTTPQAPTSGQGLPQQIGGAVESAFNRSLDRGHSMHSRSARPQVPA